MHFFRHTHCNFRVFAYQTILDWCDAAVKGIVILILSLRAGVPSMSR